MSQATRSWVWTRWWQGVTPPAKLLHTVPQMLLVVITFSQVDQLNITIATGITQATIFLLAMPLAVHVVGDTNLGMFTATSMGYALSPVTLCLDAPLIDLLDKPGATV
ncbi:hypothetical protein H257_09320 [Aphanomyces astaci]|uniref:Uncharacterized protein n=1 Tax=Aphanomyces astaci TaxID=112090 RepID=W4GB17_APHAT|nr:hypothetical protein H257_09318 [Aphanomyces astaci]XP_009833794.1 hypothetical protein H257_09320 [Aphanomyces astaci]ETV76880.1 hypothetical protein H257_09318 [Aphanomyces astaci]ETV76882.1 hypothetical protein H257_09320 [Aphanomyces astaci]|eukprot:XP_009833792.1 hypothetical protein H257_09318 [Aphanomyces astaci]